MSVMRDLPSPVQINITGFKAGGVGSRGKRNWQVEQPLTAEVCDCFKCGAAVKSEAPRDTLGYETKKT